MRCARCNRPLTEATAQIRTRTGWLQFGPKCARAAGLTEKKARISVEVVRQDDKQIDWVEGVM